MFSESLGSRPNLKFKFFSEGGGSRPNLKFKIYGWRVGHLSMSRLNPKFKIFSEDWGSVIFMSRPNLKFKNVQWELGVQAKSEIWKFSMRIWGLSSFNDPDQFQNLNFSVRVWWIGHLTMSRPNLKCKIFGEGGGVRSSFLVQAKSEI